MLKFKVIGRKSPKDHTLKYYGCLVPTTPVSREELFQEIAEECTVTSADVKAVIDRLELKIIQKLKDGKSIRLGDLGSFHLTMRTKGVAAETDFKSPADIKSLHVRFNRSARIYNYFKLSNPEVKLVQVNKKK